MKKIIVGMSGGIDSTVSAYLLKQQGYEVVGITFKMWDEASRCCNYDDIMDAKKACFKIGIRHYIINIKKHFKNKVVDYFINDYLNGKTPNPCVVCNEEVKFEMLIKKMKELEFDFVATGHYAKIKKINDEFYLTEAKDKKKTQEYFLARLSKDKLKYIKFPLGNLTKEEVRKIAKNAGFNIEKKESQEVCFLKETQSPSDFILKFVNNDNLKKCTICDIYGNEIKTLDKPFFCYTIGQRKGIGIGGGKPFYVYKILPKDKKILIAEEDKIYSNKCEIEKLNLYKKLKKNIFIAKVKIRYLHKKADAKIFLNGDIAEIEFKQKQFAITPGQLAVIYDIRGKTVLGSGFIKN